MELISIKAATVIASNGVIACLITFMSVSKAFINIYKLCIKHCTYIPVYMYIQVHKKDCLDSVPNK